MYTYKYIYIYIHVHHSFSSLYIYVHVLTPSVTNVSIYIREMGNGSSTMDTNDAMRQFVGNARAHLEGRPNRGNSVEIILTEDH